MKEYKKSAVILIFNDKGELALQLRSKNDDSFPLYWDFSAGGGVDKGENENDAAARELREELGINADLQLISKEHFKYPSYKPGVTRETDLFIYKGNHNGPFVLDSQEIEKVQFFNLETVQQMINAQEKFHPEFILMWEKGIIKS